MKPSLATPLARYLATRPSAVTPLVVSDYLQQGSVLVSSADAASLRELLPELQQKVARVADSDRFRLRLEVLARFFEESTEETPARREVAFVLFYFLKGYDLVPDAIPHVGLLDDALMVESVMQRNRLALREHWAARRRPWPESA